MMTVARRGHGRRPPSYTRGIRKTSHCGKKFMPWCLEDLQRIYSRLDIHFDLQHGESFYQPMLAGVVDELLAGDCPGERWRPSVFSFPIRREKPTKTVSRCTCSPRLLYVRRMELYLRDQRCGLRSLPHGEASSGCRRLCCGSPAIGPFPADVRDRAAFGAYERKTGARGLRQNHRKRWQTLQDPRRGNRRTRRIAR